MAFVRPGPVEILRASQKDEIVIKDFQKRLGHLLHCVDIKTYMKYKNLTLYLGRFLFYWNTTLSGLQTVGEEQASIVLVDSTLRALPSKRRLWMFALFDCVNEWQSESSISGRDTFAVLYLCKRLLSLLHRSLFYFNLTTNHLSKTILGIHYVMYRFWLKDRGSIYGVKLLGLFTTLLFVFNCFMIWPTFQRSRSNLSLKKSEVPFKSSYQCVICVGYCSLPTTTSCGHIFCWDCIMKWVQAEERCPICREPVAPNRLVPLRNYVKH